VSGHITVLAILDIMMIGVSFLLFDDDLIDGPVGKDNT
jgi:hypothetical protein